MSAKIVWEWRQRDFSGWTSHQTKTNATRVRRVWEGLGWECTNLWAGGHDIRLVARRRLVDMAARKTELAAIRMSTARAALDALTGPERVEVLRHYGGSAKKAIDANQPRVEHVFVSCGCCDCCTCGAP